MTVNVRLLNLAQCDVQIVFIQAEQGLRGVITMGVEKA
jgi:hypothetical protein